VAHEHGLHRSVCRHLFPEIERVVRTELYENALENIISTRGSPNRPRFLREIGEVLVLGELPFGYFGFKLFTRLNEHLYLSIWDEAQRERIKADPVPNRHAAVHGLVIYKSFKNSLNTIIMTDYVFRIIHVLKAIMKSTAPD
jgi:hypothetical protein